MLKRNDQKEFVFTCDLCGKQFNSKKFVPFLASQEVMQKQGWSIYKDRERGWRHECRTCTKYI